MLRVPETPVGLGLCLTHGAGANCRAPLLVALAEAFCSAGWHVLQFDLAFRVARASGPPHPAHSERDRDSIRRAVTALREHVAGPIVVGGHSYGGRQASMLLAEDPNAADGLLALSYPLHPPGKPEQLRVAHWPHIASPVLFVHGTKDPFGSVSELVAQFKHLKCAHALQTIESAGHDLKRGRFDIARQVFQPLAAILGK